jgi:hypothetical protein
MKQIRVKYNQALNNLELPMAAEIIDDFGERNTIDCLNWKNDFPYKPITYFTIARTKEGLIIKFDVKGSMLKAIYSRDQEAVNEDSCVEFFCKLPESDTYINLEFNCIGTCKAARRVSRKEAVVPFTESELSQISRYPSLGNRPFMEMTGTFQWDLTVKIPFSLLGIKGNNFPAKLLGNFYKCADNTDSPHYLSWNPIVTEKPDFHRPEFFGELLFE